MAVIDNTHAPALPAHPMANPGYGKRSVPGQPRRTGRDFGHLDTRDAYVAAHLDRLPDGAAIDVKTLAKTLPAYGQRAVRNALRSLSKAGHYRRVRGRIGGGRPQWVHRSYFSRRARDRAFWWSYLDAEGIEHAVILDDDEPEPRTGEDADAELTPPPEEPSEEPSEEPPDAPSAEPPRGPHPGHAGAAAGPSTGGPSAAHRVLAGLGKRDPRLVLSEKECAALEPLVNVWLERGTAPEGVTQALSAGLPPVVFSSAGLLRRRLREKLPPDLTVLPGPPTTWDPPVRWEEVCGVCDRPASAGPLVDGLCIRCHLTPEPDEVHEHAAGIRQAMADRRTAGQAR